MFGKHRAKLKPATRALLLLALALLLASCSSVSVENKSKDQAARVSMYLPDRYGASSFTLGPGESASELSTEAGLVVILVMPNDEYVRQLEELKKYYQTILKVPTFTEADYKDAAKKVKEFNEKIGQASIGGNSCYVRVAENDDVVASVSWDESNVKWNIQCAVRKAETESVPSD